MVQTVVPGGNVAGLAKFPAQGVVSSAVRGRGVITVSAKGISNGLSDIINDGADFGVDTPQTQTSGIQEAVNYAWDNKIYKIKVLAGMFQMNMDFVNQQSQIENAYIIEIPANSISNPIITFEIEGTLGNTSDYQTGYNATPSITPTSPNIGSVIYIPQLLTNNPVGGSAIFGSAVPPTENADAGLNNNVNIILKNVAIMNQLPSSSGYQLSAWQLDNFAGFDVDNIVATVYTPTGSLENPSTTVNGTSSTSGQNGISINQPNNGNGLARIRSAYVVNYLFGIWVNHCQHLRIDYAFAQYNTVGLLLGNVGNYAPLINMIDLEQNTNAVYFSNSSPLQLYNSSFQIQNQGAYSTTDWSNAQRDFYFTNSANVYGDIELYITGGSFTDNPLFGGNTQYNFLNIRQRLGDGSIGALPLTVPDVPASGSSSQNTNPYSVKVYVNGGAVTEIQIAIGSNTYTVYSNSTASAVYEGFTLPAGASITLTYTTAPTWSWVPE